MSYIPGVISDQTRVLHAAMQLTTFTLAQLAELAGLEEPEVQAVVNCSRDMIEEVSKRVARSSRVGIPSPPLGVPAPLGVRSPLGILSPLGIPSLTARSRERPPTEAPEVNQVVPEKLYRLRESARPRLTREAVDLAERLRAVPRASSQDAARTAIVALDAAESSAELRKLADSDRRAWGERAVVQLDLARRLVVLVSDSTCRASLRRRLVQLAGHLEGIPLPPPPKPPASAQRPATKPFKTPSVPSSRARTVWRSPNRRLYDAVERRFITLEDIRRLVNEDIDFAVMDKRGRGDITRFILLQMISELEEQGEPLLTRDFLLELIRCRAREPRELVGIYLDHTLRMFAGERATPP